MSAKTIFMTGASGYIGNAIINQAIPLGYTIRALSRSEKSDEKLLSIGATPVRGSLTTHSVLTEEATKASIVIAIADSGAESHYTIPKAERFSTNNAAISALAEGMKGSGKPLVITSGTLAVAPDPQGNETDETSPIWPVDSFYGTDFEAKSLVHKDQGIRVCMVRLAPYVHGKGGSTVGLFLKNFAEAGAGFYVDDGAARTTSVHVDDAARLYLLAAEKGKAGEVYNASAETSVTQKEIVETIGKVLGISIVAMPYEQAMEAAGKFATEFLKVENRATGRKAREQLGWEIKAEYGILGEIEHGSYAEVAKEMKKTS